MFIYLEDISKSESFDSGDQDDESNSIKTEWIENESKAKQSTFRSPSIHDQSNPSISDISNNLFTPTKNDTPSLNKESSSTPKVKKVENQEEIKNSILQLHSVKKPSSKLNDDSISSSSSSESSSKR